MPLDIDWSSALAVLLAAMASVFVMAVADRFPRITRVLTWLGAVVLVGVVGVALVALPQLVLGLIGLFAGVNVMLGIAATSMSIKTKPADNRAVSVWAVEIQQLHDLGWRYLGTWVLDQGQRFPAMSIMERPEDGTRVGMLGTAPQGGVISIDTLLDEGFGVLVTLRERAMSLRPPWMFRQELKGLSLLEMVARHDEALFFLRAHGIAGGGTVPGDPLDFDRLIHSWLRRYVKRRWWMWAMRPLARRFQPRTTLPLHEQDGIPSQIRRYRSARGRDRDAAFG